MPSVVLRRLATIIVLAAALTASAQDPGPASVSVRLVGGDVLIGTLISHDDQAVVIQHPVLGTVTLPAEQVAQVLSPAQAAEREAAAADEQATDGAPDGPPPEPDTPPEGWEAFIANWDARIELGVSGSEGNTEEFEFRGAFIAEKQTELDRWRFEVEADYATSDGDKIENNIHAAVVKDWLVPDSPVFYFAQGRWDYDEFEAWDHRVSVAGGIGYAFLDEDPFQLLGRAGLALTREFGSDDDEIRPEGYLGVDFEWQITDAQTFAFSNTFYPSLSDLGQFRNLTTAEWRIKLDRADGVSFKLGLENEYESETAGDAKHNDLMYYGALVFEF